MCNLSGSNYTGHDEKNTRELTAELDAFFGAGSK